MVAQRQLHVKVISVDAENGAQLVGSFDAEGEPRFRPSDLLPWADPYIAGLVRRLQDQVREEVATTRAERPTAPAPPAADLEWPWHGDDADFEPLEREPVAAPAGGDDAWGSNDRG